LKGCAVTNASKALLALNEAATTHICVTIKAIANHTQRICKLRSQLKKVEQKKPSASDASILPEGSRRNFRGFHS
jgi:hypothetical protein